jgi:ribonuclease VapC
MVVDTSALLALAFLQPDAERFLEAFEGADVRLISAASALEAAIIADQRSGAGASDDLDDLMARLGLEIKPVDVAQIRIAREAYRRYGKGNHPAALNFGDCFAYALAKLTGLPLLFKGDDFARTDLVAAFGQSR